MAKKPRLTRLQKSQKAHSRLHALWCTIFGDHEADVKEDYHWTILSLQDKSKRVIPRKERKILFDYLHQSKFGLSSGEKEVGRSEYLKIVRKYND